MKAEKGKTHKTFDKIKKIVALQMVGMIFASLARPKIKVERYVQRKRKIVFIYHVVELWPFLPPY